MLQREVMKKLLSVHRSIFVIRNGSSSNLDIKKLETESSVVDVSAIDEEAKLKEELLEKKRNKSRLREADRKVLHEINPYPESMLWHHGTVRYLRRAYGRYGQASGVNPSICWPIKDELSNAIEYEQIKYPYNVMDVAKAARQKRKEREERILARQAEIVMKMEKLEMWKQDLQNRIAKKENEAKAARDRKERLIEEVKRHFGYTVDPKDDKFKELLEKKEKEQKKAMKEAKRKAKEAKVVEKLLKKGDEKPVDEAREESQK